LISQQLSFNN